MWSTFLVYSFRCSVVIWDHCDGETAFSLNSSAKRYSPMQPIAFISSSLWSSTTLSSISSWMWTWSVAFLMPSSFTTLLIASLLWLSNLFGGFPRPAWILTDFSIHLRMVSTCDLILPFFDIIHSENAGGSSFCIFSHSWSNSSSSTSTNPFNLFPWNSPPRILLTM